MNDTSPKLNIALVSDAIYPYNIGGKEKRIYELSTRLAQKGHTVTIYTMKWWKGVNNRVEHEGVIHEAISPFYPLYSGERRSIREAIMFSFNCLKLITKDFDLLEVDHMPHLILFPIKFVCLLKRKKMYTTWNEVWGWRYWIKYLGILGSIAYLIEKLSVMLPNVIISVSKHTTNRLRSELGVRKKIVTIPNGIDLNALDKIPISKHTSDIIYVGRLLKHKNVDKLLHAIAEILPENPKLICRIIGNGPEEAKLKRLAKELRVEENVIFQDFLPENSDVFSLIKASKILALPSSREGFGLAVIESQALGVPVITYDYPDNAARYLIQEGTNGYLFDNFTNSFSTTIKKALTKTFDTKQIRLSVSKFDWTILVDQLEEEYKK